MNSRLDPFQVSTDLASVSSMVENAFERTDDSNVEWLLQTDEVGDMIARLHHL